MSVLKMKLSEINKNIKKEAAKEVPEYNPVEVKMQLATHDNKIYVSVGGKVISLDATANPELAAQLRSTAKPVKKW